MHNINPRIGGTSTNTPDAMSLVVHQLKAIKKMCVTYSIAHKIMSGDYDEKNDISLIKKLVYIPKTNSLYIYVTDPKFAYYIKGILPPQLAIMNGAGVVNSCIDELLVNNLYCIELVFHEDNTLNGTDELIKVNYDQSISI